MRIVHTITLKLKDSRVLRRFHAWMTFAWGMSVPITLLTNLKTSLMWIAFMSAWANFASEFSAWQSSRTEVKVDDDLSSKE